MAEPHSPFLKKFLAEMQGRDGCWEWPKYRTPEGYGLTNVDGKTTIATRAAYLLANGAFPKELFVLHKCDNPPCVRPDHLFLGTQKDNCQDAKAKDRHSRGERNGISKLTDDDVRAIRASTETQWAIARRFGVLQGAVCAIKQRRRWSHVQD